MCTVYAFSNIFDAASTETTVRRLHLGTDIWGDSLTPILSPLYGRVHSFGNNNSKGDYGATLILMHEIEDETFYTLYGHLSKKSIQNIAVGDSIQCGQEIASFGIYQENGHWPPHLHFQIILDIGEWVGDYPGNQ